MSINIKPENRGKFTAYKERTGKTTEEALHSPNEHVRAMAQFAENASHWKHEDGTQNLNTPKMKKLKYGLGTEELGGKPKKPTAKQMSEESKKKRAEAMGKKADNIDEKINQAAINAPKNDHGAPAGDQQFKDVPPRKKKVFPKFRSSDQYANGVTKLTAKKDPLAGVKVEIGNKEPKDPMIEKTRELAKKTPAATEEHAEEKKEAVSPKINVSSKADTDSMTFGKAFAHHRASGAKDFTWKGKKYTTQTKEEAEKPATKYKTPGVGTDNFDLYRIKKDVRDTHNHFMDPKAARESTPDLLKMQTKKTAEKPKETPTSTNSLASRVAAEKKTPEATKPEAPAKKSDAGYDPSGLKTAAKFVGHQVSDFLSDDKDEDTGYDPSGLKTAMKYAKKPIKHILTGGARYGFAEGTKKLKKGGKDMGC